MSWMRATPSSPRSSTMSVAPKLRASCWRVAWRLMAMMRPTPICLAESTASNPTASSPTTATVEPGCTSAAAAPNQPVPITSDKASRSGSISCEGISGVATSVPSASGTRSSGACAPPTNSACRHDVVHGTADFLDHATIFMTHRRGSGRGLDAPVRPQVGAANTGSGDTHDGVGGFENGRDGPLLEADVARPVEHGGLHGYFFSKVRVTRWRSSASWARRAISASTRSAST